MDELAKRYMGLYSGAVYDAMYYDIKQERPFVLDKSIKPIWDIGDLVLFGHAITCQSGRLCHAEHHNDDTRIKQFATFTPGCVQVLASDDDDLAAHYGDVTGSLARKFGALGVVTDGLTRDVRSLRADGFPVFCTGAAPVNSYERYHTVSYQVDVHLKGFRGRVLVQPGDFVFGDLDGVLIIPAAIVGDVLELAETRQRREDIVRSRLTQAQGVAGVNELKEVIVW